MANTEPTPSNSSGSDSGGKARARYTVIPFPKIVFFYPLMFMCIVCGIMEYFAQKAGGEPSNVAGTLFMIFFLINILVISFDFPGVKALALVLGSVSFVFGLILFDDKVMPILGPLKEIAIVLQERLHASTAFYFVISAILFLMILAGIAVNVLWNRWTIEPNRLMHRHGLLGDVREYPVIDLQLEKNVDDVFEYLLLLSGTLTFIPNPNTSPIRLENVPFINYAERKIQKIIREFRVSAD
jgi:hypothetical protein